MEYQYTYAGSSKMTNSRKAHRTVEKVMGKPLPFKAEIHHVNGDTNNNSNSNLVVCNDQAYHKLLHRRIRALIACGHANWRKCKFCKVYDAPENLYISPDGKQSLHRECMNQYKRRPISLGV